MKATENTLTDYQVKVVESNFCFLSVWCNLAFQRFFNMVLPMQSRRALERSRWVSIFAYLEVLMAFQRLSRERASVSTKAGK